MEIKNVRIDARGIHGQVATAWVPHLGVNRIIVIDDVTVKDDMQKMALKMAKPNNVKLSILSTEKAKQRLNEVGAYKDEKILIILQRIDTLKALMNLGHIFSEVNVGNVPARPSSKAYQKTIHLLAEEVEILKALIDNGTLFTAQMVPNESKVNFNQIIFEKEE